MSVAMFVFGFGVAFWYGWRLTLIYLGSFPFIAFCGVGMAMSLESGVTAMMRAYS